MDSTVSRRKNTMSFCNTHLSIREDMLAQTGGKIKENIFVGEGQENTELPDVTASDRGAPKPKRLGPLSRPGQKLFLPEDTEKEEKGEDSGEYSGGGRDEPHPIQPQSAGQYKQGEEGEDESPAECQD